MDLIQEGLVKEGLRRNLIRFEDNGKYIVYSSQQKRRNFENPEERVQADAFLKLVLVYGYPVTRMLQYVPVQMGSQTKEADIILYEDDARKAPLLIVECKKPNINELEFGRAADQAVSYAVAEGARYVWVTNKLKNEYFEIPRKKPKARITIPDVPQFGVRELARFKFAVGGGTAKNGQKLFPLEVVSQDELTRRFQQAHQALWGGGELNPSEAFDELDKLIFCKLWDERKLRRPGEPYDFQIFTEDTSDKTERSLLERLKGLYEEGRKRDPEVFKDDIRLTPGKARTVVSYLESIDLSQTDLDSKGRAFETFMGSFFRGDFGQYFTPRPIVKFMVDALPITNESLVLDTSCGSGGFLLHALDRVRREADVYYPNQLGPPEGAQHHRHWHDFAARNLYGIEINEQIARTAKMNMIIHDDGHTNVVAADGLAPAEHIRERTNNQGFRYGRFDFIITNPPFGSIVRQTEKAYLHRYRLATRELDWLNPNSKPADRPSQDTEILFIEQCWHYLSEGGYLGIVIPDGILTSSSLQYVRDVIEDLFRIIAVVSLPQTAFTATGAGVKSSVLFVKKHTATITNLFRDTKEALKDTIRTQQNFEALLSDIYRQKKKALADLTQQPEFKALNITERKVNPEYISAAKEINDRFAEKAEQLRYRLAEIFDERRRRQLPDYEIFMAIAEDIGYDAVGRETKTNELEPIAAELSRFIHDIEEGTGSMLTLSSDVNLPNAFLIRRREIKRRLDPAYNLALRTTRFSSKYPVQKIRDIAMSRTGGTPSKGQPEYWEGNIPWASPKDFGTFYLQDTEDHISQEAVADSATTVVPPGTLLIVFRSGILQHSLPVTITTKDTAINQDLKALICRDAVSAEYLAAYFSIFGARLLPLITKSGATVQSINTEQFDELEIPIPPIQEQRAIVERLLGAYKKAAALRAQAAAELEAAKAKIEGVILDGAVA
jgi:type I restriction enzyme M protein